MGDAKGNASPAIAHSVSNTSSEWGWGSFFLFVYLGLFKKTASRADFFVVVLLVLLKVLVEM